MPRPLTKRPFKRSFCPLARARARGRVGNVKIDDRFLTIARFTRHDRSLATTESSSWLNPSGFSRLQDESGGALENVPEASSGRVMPASNLATVSLTLSSGGSAVDLGRRSAAPKLALSLHRPILCSFLQIGSSGLPFSVLRSGSKLLGHANPADKYPPEILTS